VEALVVLSSRLFFMAALQSKEDPKFHHLWHHLRAFKANDKSQIMRMLATIGLEALLSHDNEGSLIEIKSYFG
jgi:hypothetical protein